jgi:glycosyltransferase involved in cell wall biosynthesis
MKFSIVTPAYNMENWIRETLETVLSQAGDFDIEYIVISDGSKDSTLKIAESYKQRLENGSWPITCRSITMTCLDQENVGMYETINRGFARATGDIFAWINADDIYEPDAFEAMRKVFEAFPEFEWVKGITSTIDESGKNKLFGHCQIYHHDWLELGVYGQESYFVEQDSVFWRKELWQKAGPMPASYRSAGDYWLWLQFAKFAPLWSMNIPISCFRKRQGQISKGIVKYKQEQFQARPKRSFAAWRARIFFSLRSRLSRMMPSLENIFIWLYPIIFMNRGYTEYIEIENGQPVKRTMRSYKI